MLRLRLEPAHTRQNRSKLHSALAYSQPSMVNSQWSIFNGQRALRLSEVTEDDFDLADGEEALLRTIVGIGKVAHELGTATHPVRKTIEGRPHLEIGGVKHGQLTLAHSSRTDV